MHIRILGRLFGTAPNAADAHAADRYRYLLRTAPPVAIERAHTEALRQLTPTQRHQLLRQVRRQLPDAVAFDTELDPRALARLLTCAELRRPGILERALAAQAGLSLFWALAQAFTAVPIAQQFLGAIDYDGVATDPREHTEPEQEFDYEDAGYESPPLEYFFGRSDSRL